MKNALVSHPLNTQGRDFVVGDIHGYFHTLEWLLDRIGFDKSADRLFSVGDLIDRGPESHRAAEFLAYPWFHAIRGNHEQMLCDSLTPGLRQPAAIELWQNNGGDWFASVEDKDRMALFQALRELPLAMEIALPDGGTAVLAHADLDTPNWTTGRTQLTDAERREALSRTLLWSRERAKRVQARAHGAPPQERLQIAGASVVFFGHTPMSAPIACDNTRWIDTGVFLDDGRLTVAELAADGAVWCGAEGEASPQAEWQRLPDSPAGPPADSQPVARPAKRRKSWLPWRR